MLAHLSNLWNGVRHLVMPGICFACHCPLSPDREDFCALCLDQLTGDAQSTCPRCSSTVGAHVDCTEGCSKCRDESFGFDRAVRLGPYDGLLSDMIVRMKQPGSEGLAEAVGESWSGHAASRLRGTGVEMVVAVPLHWRRQWQRGFNQSEFLARAWADRLRLPLRSSWLRRIRATPKQAFLSATARRENVKGAFRVSRRARFEGRAVLLVDDVLTTGSTMNEAARTMKRAGAKSVIAAVLGHDH
jgi:ComF family protein